MANIIGSGEINLVDVEDVHSLQELDFNEYTKLQNTVTQIQLLPEQIKLSVRTDYIDPLELRMNSAEIKLTDESITSIIKNSSIQLDINENKNKIVDVESSITQQADKISLLVKDNNTINGDSLIGAINLSSTKIEEHALNIDLSGYVTFNSLKESGSTIINGDNITTGKIDASKIDVINLNADYITSGTINADMIKGGTIRGVSIITDANAVVGNEITLGEPYGDNITLMNATDSFYLLRNHNRVLKFFDNDLWVDGHLAIANGGVIGVNYGLGGTSRNPVMRLESTKITMLQTVDFNNQTIQNLKINGVTDQNFTPYTIQFKMYNGNLYFKNDYYGWKELLNAYTD